jgi:hypothetical protein
MLIMIHRTHTQNRYVVYGKRGTLYRVNQGVALVGVRDKMKAFTRDNRMHLGTCIQYA